MKKIAIVMYVSNTKRDVFYKTFLYNSDCQSLSKIESLYKERNAHLMYYTSTIIFESGMFINNLFLFLYGEGSEFTKFICSNFDSTHIYASLSYTDFTKNFNLINLNYFNISSSAFGRFVDVSIKDMYDLLVFAIFDKCRHLNTLWGRKEVYENA